MPLEFYISGFLDFQISTNMCGNVKPSWNNKYKWCVNIYRAAKWKIVAKRGKKNCGRKSTNYTTPFLTASVFVFVNLYFSICICMWKDVSTSGNTHYTPSEFVRYLFLGSVLKTYQPLYFVFHMKTWKICKKVIYKGGS